MIEIYNTRNGNILSSSRYTKSDLVDIFGRRVAERLIAGHTYTNRKQRLVRMTKATFKRKFKSKRV